jgi:phosphate transport system substrate-binding protein
MRTTLPLLALTLLLGACATPRATRPTGTVRYVGSSTVAVFVRAAEPLYGAIRFEIDTRPESAGGEAAILEGRADLAGTARVPAAETLLAGVSAELLGRDAIAVVVHEDLPVRDLGLADLSRIFRGEVTGWSELGGPDLPVRPFVMGTGSATRAVFRAAVLGDADYAGCEDVQPDGTLPERVAATPGGIGTISFSFLESARGVRPLAIGGEEPAVTNFDYPISRPLYLLWHEGSPVVDAFVAWAATSEGQRAVMQSFVGARVRGAVRSTAPATPVHGTLVVRTPTFEVDDGGIYYHPHRPYQILDTGGLVLRSVPNHRGVNDERPMRIELAPGTYLIRYEDARDEVHEFLVSVEAGKTTELDVSA